MRKDIEYPLSYACHSLEQFKAAVHSVQPYLVQREIAQKWARQLRFIAINDYTTMELEPVPWPVCDCSEIPFFPDDEPISELCITKPDSLVECLHYVAVSYRWHTEDASSPKYPVSMEDGSRRASKAPKDVLDRAIAFAASKRLSLIWIDQECIVQDDRDDKESGIQSMDLVFQNSLYPIALLSPRITRQEHITALFKAVENKNFDNIEELINAVEVLEMLMNDEWHSRAWCFQEAASAGPELTLLVRYDEGLRAPTTSIPGEIEITMKELVVAACSVSNALPEPPDHSLSYKADADVFRRIQLIFERITLKGPAVFHDFPNERYSCNAAQAMDLLVSRRHSRIPDALAIIANLCNYPTRINTAALVSVEKQKNQDFSLSLCIYALAIANGDLSLLWGAKLQLESVGAPPEAIPSWFPNLDTALHGLPFNEELGVQYLLEPLETMVDRVKLSASLWKVKLQIEFNDIEVQYRRKWRLVQRQTSTIHTKTRQELAKDIFMAIISKLFWLNKPMLANSLWTSLSSELEPSVISQPLSADQRTLLVDRPYYPQGLGWVIDVIMEKGCLWFAERVEDSSMPSEPSVCVFDYHETGYILKPTANASISSNFRIKSRYTPSSWVVNRTNQVVDGIEVLQGRGLVRGFWATDEAPTQTYMLI